MFLRSTTKPPILMFLFLPNKICLKLFVYSYLF